MEWVYCADCPANRVRCGRDQEEAVQETKGASDRGQIANFNASAIAEHAWSASHSVGWNGVTVLDQHKNLHPRLILEFTVLGSSPSH